MEKNGFEKRTVWGHILKDFDTGIEDIHLGEESLEDVLDFLPEKVKVELIQDIENTFNEKNSKGKVEILAKIMNRLKAYNGEFSNQYDLIKIIDDLNVSLNNEIVQGINQKPIDRFQKEKIIIISQIKDMII
mgnify:CR=1 FL=1